MTLAAPEIDLPSASDILLDPSYDPQEHLLPERRKDNIAEVPGHPDILVRWFPYDNKTARSLERRFYAPLSPDILQGVSDSRDEHLRIIEKDCGIAVVRHAAEVVPINTAAWRGDSIATVVQRLNGPSLNSQREEGLGNEVPAKLLDYLGRVMRKEVILSDIYVPSQFTVSKEGDDRQVVLHDIEPRFIPRSMLSHILNRPEFLAWQKQAMGHYWNGN